MTTVSAVVDSNSISDDGTTRVRPANLTGPVSIGADVRVHEPEDDITGRGTVVRISGTYVHIVIDRGNLR